MKIVTLNDKKFAVSLPETEIKARVKELAEQISRDMDGKNPLFIPILNGAFMFAADLIREMTIPSEITFVKLSSYQGTSSTGKVQEMIGVGEDLTGRNVVIVEDIVETGLTVCKMVEQAKALNAASVKVCSLFFKPELLKDGQAPDYVAFSIPNDFIVGYGLDYNQKGRWLRDIYTLVSD